MPSVAKISRDHQIPFYSGSNCCRILSYIELQVLSLTPFTGFNCCPPELPRMPNIFPIWWLIFYWEIILMYFSPSNLLSRLRMPHSFTQSLYVMVFNSLCQPRCSIVYQQSSEIVAKNIPSSVDSSGAQFSYLIQSFFIIIINSD